MGSRRPKAIDYFEEAAGGAALTARALRSVRLSTEDKPIVAKIVQPGRGCHPERNGFGIQADDGGVAETARSNSSVGVRIEARWMS